MTEGGLPDGMCVHGAIGSQYQFRKNVPKISSSPVAMKIAANKGQRGDRSTNQAKTGRHIAPCRSKRPVMSGRTVNPASAQVEAPARITCATRRPYFITTGVRAASNPKRYTAPWPGGTNN